MKSEGILGASEQNLLLKDGLCYPSSSRTCRAETRDAPRGCVGRMARRPAAAARLNPITPARSSPIPLAVVPSTWSARRGDTSRRHSIDRLRHGANRHAPRRLRRRLAAARIYAPDASRPWLPTTAPAPPRRARQAGRHRQPSFCKPQNPFPVSSATAYLDCLAESADKAVEVVAQAIIAADGRQKPGVPRVERMIGK